MKGITPYPFKRLSLALVQISLIAGTLAMGSTPLSAKRGLNNCKANCNLSFVYERESSQNVYSPSTDSIVANPEVLYTLIIEQFTSYNFWKEIHRSRFSGLPPPKLA